MTETGSSAPRWRVGTSGWKHLLVTIAPFVYVRVHGRRGRYCGEYGVD